MPGGDMSDSSRRRLLWFTCRGARDAGITAWLWGSDVRSFARVAERVLRPEGWWVEDDDDDAEAGEEGGLRAESG